MRSDQRFRYIRSYPDSFPIGVKWLLISNTAIFFLMVIAAKINPDTAEWFLPLELAPIMVIHLAVWQLVTYMFLHGGIMHILFNMLTLYWFGPDLERTWGLQRFLKYYMICGVGAGVCVVIVALFSGGRAMTTPTVGASGAILGLILAYGLLFPDRTILFFFVIPMKVRHFVWIIGLLAFFYSITDTNSGVSNVAHLGGMLVGYFYLRAKLMRLDRDSLMKRYKQWKLQRAKKKFQVYMRKHGGPGGTMLQ
jgi:membrane associated rhomboid family serine protease